jgi:hypothetical protein
MWGNRTYLACNRALAKAEATKCQIRNRLNRYVDAMAAFHATGLTRELHRRRRLQGPKMFGFVFNRRFRQRVGRGDEQHHEQSPFHGATPLLGWEFQRFYRLFQLDRIRTSRRRFYARGRTNLARRVRVMGKIGAARKSYRGDRDLLIDRHQRYVKLLINRITGQ